MDEATSSVDQETDILIQRCIRRFFADTTIITIAHRLSTISDYDRIVVMENGGIKQTGKPSELIVDGKLREEQAGEKKV